jgi:putative flippase GtrA
MTTNIKFKLKERQRFIKYLLGGVLSTCSDIIIFNSLLIYLIIYYLIANSISFTFAVIIAFFFHKYITFEHHDTKVIASQFSSFFIASIASVFLSSLLIFSFVNFLYLTPTNAKFLQVIISYPINYFLIRKFVFWD